MHRQLLLSSFQAAKIFKYIRAKNCVQMALVATEKGEISSELFEFALLVDGPDARENAWVLNCCAALAYNDITTRTDLISLLADDLCVTNEHTGLAVTGGQRAWIRRCIEKADKEVVGAIATRGEDAPPQQSEASAIKALVDTIKSEEACDSVRFFADIHSCFADVR